MSLPTHALSIMQPWAWLIVNGHKTIENRDWLTKRRGAIQVHAGQKIDISAHHALLRGEHPVTGEPAADLGKAYTEAVRDNAVHRGGIVGVATITDCVAASSDPWFVGDFGFVLADARPLPFRPLRGALSFFAVDAKA